MSSPVARTLAKLRDEGYHPAVVERSIPTRPHPTKQDLYGVADVEALAPDHTLYVQVCRDADLIDHLAKYASETRLEILLYCPHRRFEIWSWAKRGRAWSERRLVAIPSAPDRRPGVTFIERARSRETPMGRARGAR